MVEQHGSSALQGLLTAQAGSGRLVSSRGWMAGAATDPAQHYPVQSPWDWFPATWGRADPAFLSVVFRCVLVVHRPVPCSTMCADSL